TSKDYDAPSPSLPDKQSLKIASLPTGNDNAETVFAYDNDQPCDRFNHLLFPNIVLQQTNTEGSCFINMFGLVTERCVTFCIDTSGSMFNALDVVKMQLMETLSHLASREVKVMFNLIEFNSQVTQWADKLVQCTPETVAVARQWVSNLKAKTGTNTQGALFAALADPACQAVYLVTDDIPDQYTEDVLDNIIAICGNRRIHCIYITGDEADEAATEFLEDLAVETFGSFTIVKLLSNGSIEKVIPVYRSDPSHEKLVWTVNNTLRPNVRTCSVSTTLQLDPDEVLGIHPLDSSLMFNTNPVAVPSPLVSTYADRYYYPYCWSRYNQSRGWLKAQDKLRQPLLGLSHVAGSLLVGKKVIARRLEDGYFYRGTIQSQNFGKSFLVAFGPRKHSRFNQTEYEDVFVFDIVDYSDALRHSIITGDRVLAPEQPDGERFAPAIVIDGQEKRQADGPEDKDLTVCFSSGKTENIPRDVAVWIPPTMYDRLSLELQMSASSRKSIFSTLKKYPAEHLPGYPKLEYPGDYFIADPFVVKPNPYLWDPSLYWYPYRPDSYSYLPFVVKKREEKGRRSPQPDDDSALIPDTGMTKQELEARVMSQLMEHRCNSADTSVSKSFDIMSNGSKQDTAKTSSTILRKREKQEDNLLNKHVQFKTEKETDAQRDEDSKYFHDSDYDDYGNLIRKNDTAVNTDSSLLFYSSPGIEPRPVWKKYWHHDPTRSLSASSGGSGGTRKLTYTNKFRETAPQAPLEARNQRNPPYDVEWPSSAFRYVDVFAKSDHTNSVRDCLSAPELSTKENVSPSIQSNTVASQPLAKLTSEEREEIRRANRRRRVLKREAEWQERLGEENSMKALMQDNHRERILQQLERDQQRKIQQQEDIQRVREAKKKISADLRKRIEANQKDEAQKEANRITALSKGRERREQIEMQHEQEIQECVERRQQIHKQNNEARMKANVERLDEEALNAAKLEKQHQKAKLQRLRHFQKLEKEGQKKKDLRSSVAEQHQAINRSHIFS
ncbi:unnamed protein product, partial [Candidula unifasciata]